MKNWSLDLDVGKDENAENRQYSLDQHCPVEVSGDGNGLCLCFPIW